MAGDAVDHGRDQDLRRHVELKGKGDEDPKAVEELHDLVHPAKRVGERTAINTNTVMGSRPAVRVFDS